jgi:hypothetical protein
MSAMGTPALRRLAVWLCWVDLLAAVAVALLAATVPGVSPGGALVCLGLALACRGLVAILDGEADGEDSTR